MGFAPIEYGGAVLKKFGVDTSALLGQGAHSRVFAIDSNHVIRVFAPGADWEHVVSVANFYNTLDISQVNFSVPVVHDVGSIDGLFFSIENRLGNNLEQSLKYFSDSQIDRALGQYVKFSGEIKDLKTFNADLFGELLHPDPIRVSSWSEFLILRVERSLEISGESLKRDVDSFDEIYSAWQKRVIQFQEPQKDIVHGDYYPGNVIVSDDANVTELIDFSMYTVIGDWRLDPISAVIQAELGGLEKGLVAEIKKKVQNQFQIEQEVFDFYTVYYSLMLSWRVFEDPERLYKGFCVNNIRALTPYLLSD